MSSLFSILSVATLIKLYQNLTLPRIKDRGATGREKELVGPSNMTATDLLMPSMTPSARISELPEHELAQVQKMFDGVAVHGWFCINFVGGLGDCMISRFCYYLGKACIPSGLAFNPDPVLPVFNLYHFEVEHALKARFCDAKTKLQGNDLDLLIAILPNHNSASLHSDLKQLCEKELGIVFQGCWEKDVTWMRKQYLKNVALEIKVKVGSLRISRVPTGNFGDVPHPVEDSCSPSVLVEDDAAKMWAACAYNWDIPPPVCGCTCFRVWDMDANEEEDNSYTPTVPVYSPTSPLGGFNG